LPTLDNAAPETAAFIPNRASERAIRAKLRFKLAVQRVGTEAAAIRWSKAEITMDSAATDSGNGAGSDRTVDLWQVGRRGWWAVLKRVFSFMATERVTLTAAGVSYYTLLALFPALAALVSVYGLVNDANSLSAHLDTLSGIVPKSILDFIGTELTRLLQSNPGRLGLGAVVSLLVALWSANGGVKSMFWAMNTAYDGPEERSFIRLNLITLAFTLGAMVVFVVVINALVIMPLLVSALGLGAIGKLLGTVIPGVIAFVIVYAAIALIYRFGPSRPPAGWRWFTPGALAAAIVWLVASIGFSFYLANFSNYDATYGTLGTAIGLLIWLYISAFIVIVGADLNAELEKQAIGTESLPPSA
jgi:membrane protein